MRILLHKLRMEKGYSLRDLQEATGISHSTLQRYEKVGSRSANIYNLEKIAKAFDCKITDLFESEYK